jgi:hypothetical protein
MRSLPQLSFRSPIFLRGDVDGHNLYLDLLGAFHITRDLESPLLLPLPLRKCICDRLTLSEYVAISEVEEELLTEEHARPEHSSTVDAPNSVGWLRRFLPLQVTRRASTYVVINSPISPTIASPSLLSGVKATTPLLKIAIDWPPVVEFHIRS